MRLKGKFQFMLNTFYYKSTTIPCFAFIAYTLSSCHVVKYELALPQYSHKSHIVKRKRYTFPPDSIVRDEDYHFFLRVPIDVTMDGYSIYRGDTMVHNCAVGCFLFNWQGGGYEWVDKAVDPCNKTILHLDDGQYHPWKWPD